MGITGRQLWSDYLNGHYVAAESVDPQLAKGCEQVLRGWIEKDPASVVEHEVYLSRKHRQIRIEELVERMAEEDYIGWTHILAMPDPTNPFHYDVFASIVWSHDGECKEIAFPLGHWVYLYGKWTAIPGWLTPGTQSVVKD